MEISGKNIVVTGGASGIGRALCERFAKEGAAHITVVDLHEEGARAVADPLGGTGVGVDVSDRAAIEKLVADVTAAQGPIDLFVSNAGILVAGGPEQSVDDWNRIWDVNVMAHVHAAHAVLPGMLERGEGYLLNTCSAAGLLTQIGSAPYAVTKHASVAFAEWVSITYGDRGIKVSALCPQAVNTAMTAGIEGGGVAGVDGMAERGFGRVVNITSGAVKAPIDTLGLSNGARSGLTGFIAGLARQSRLAGNNVTINNLLPGPFETERLHKTLSAAADASGTPVDTLAAQRRKNVPAQRFGQADEFGAYCAFLCSTHAGFVTGQNLLLDGGSYPGTF